MHKDLIEKFGGAHGLFNEGLLEAALYRPQSGYYKDLLEKAAALLESLAMNHPFVDGNKRIAFFATDTFLRLNGYFLEQNGLAAHEHWMNLFAEGNFNFEHLLIWIRAQSQALAKTIPEN